MNVHSQPYRGGISDRNAVHKRIVELQIVADEHTELVISVSVRRKEEIEEIVGVVEDGKSCHLLKIVGRKFHFYGCFGRERVEASCDERLTVQRGDSLVSVKAQISRTLGERAHIFKGKTQSLEMRREDLAVKALVFGKLGVFYLGYVAFVIYGRNSAAVLEAQVSLPKIQRLFSVIGRPQRNATYPLPSGVSM